MCPYDLEERRLRQNPCLLDPHPFPFDRRVLVRPSRKPFVWCLLSVDPEVAGFEVRT